MRRPGSWTWYSRALKQTPLLKLYRDTIEGVLMRRWNFVWSFQRASYNSRNVSQSPNTLFALDLSLRILCIIFLLSLFVAANRVQSTTRTPTRSKLDKSSSKQTSFKILSAFWDSYKSHYRKWLCMQTR